MLRRGRIAAATAAMAAVLISTAPGAAAMPRPRSDEWWMKWWGIDLIWPASTGRGVTVAVVDTGVNGSIPDLAGVVLPGTDTDGDGSDGRKDFDTEMGHGTAMAGLIA